MNRYTQRRKEVAQLVQPGLVGAKAQADDQSTGIEPDAVSRFHRSRLGNRSDNRDTLIVVKLRMQIFFAAPQGFAQSQHDGAFRGDQRRIVGENRVGKIFRVFVQEEYFRARILNVRHQGSVIATHTFQVEWTRIVPLLRVRAGHRDIRSLHHHAPQWRDHVLRTNLLIALDSFQPVDITADQFQRIIGL